MGQTTDQIRDKDLAMAMLMDLKHTCECLNQKILEASNPQLRQSYINILHETYNEQQHLFNYMQQKGWYPTMTAHQQDISTIAGSISQMQQEITQKLNQTNYNYQQQHSGQNYYSNQSY